MVIRNLGCRLDAVRDHGMQDRRYGSRKNHASMRLLRALATIPLPIPPIYPEPQAPAAPRHYHRELKHSSLLGRFDLHLVAPCLHPP